MKVEGKKEGNFKGRYLTPYTLFYGEAISLDVPEKLRKDYDWAIRSGGDDFEGRCFPV